MAVMSIRGIDEETAKALKEKARREGTSVNAVLLKTLREVFGLEKPRRTAVHDDLDHLAGTWSEKDLLDFQDNVAAFENVDEDMWK